MNARAWAVIAAVYGLALLLVWWRFSPPPPEPRDAPVDTFSATRAIDELRDVLADERAHPVGSKANVLVRDRIAAKLEALGYAPAIDTRIMCSARGLCAELSNVVATIGDGADALLLSVHYDSVAAGPGAADDGSGVAVLLEIARLLKQGVEPANTIVFLFDDGEEAGLLGARAFMAHDPLANQIRVAINLEARGSHGPSLMFESAGATSKLAPLLGALDRPASSSLFSAVYEMLPNDTDFSVFKQHGIAGFNFGFIDGVSRYHTSIDDIAHLDPGSVQHHGDNALSLTRQLASADLKALQQGDDAVWFDVLSFFVVRWPRSWSLWLALLSTVLIAAGLIAAGPRRERFVVPAALSLGAIVVTVALGWAAVLACEATTGALVMRSEKLTLPMLALATIAAGSVVQLGTSFEASPTARFGGVWLLMALLGVVVAGLLPAASYLFVAPALIAAVAIWLPPAAHLVATAAAGVMFLHLAAGLVSGVGLMGHPAIAAILAVALVPAIAHMKKRRGFEPALFAAVAAALCVAAAQVVPRFDEADPQRKSITYWLDDGTAHVFVDTTFGPHDDETFSEVAPPLPWMGHRRVAKKAATAIEVAPPTLTDIGDGRFRLRSQRDAYAVGVITRAAVSIFVNGTRAQLRRLADGRHMMVAATPSGDGVELRMPKVDVEIFDVTPGLPDVALPKRSKAEVPSQDGDTTVVSQSWSWPR